MPHKRLLSKLKYYGISGNTLNWIESFLSDRNQQVVVDGKSSNTSKVTSGVPQGTILGPLLFLIFINDITENIQSQIRLFADDCLVYKEIANIKDAETLQKDLNTLISWTKTWQMEFNISKCAMISFKDPRKRNIIKVDYMMEGQKVQPAQDITYLGVKINSSLRWANHVNDTANKAHRLIGMLWRNLHKAPVELKKTAYQTLVRPTVEYSSSIWNPWTVKDINRIEGVQNAGARFVMNQPHRRNVRDSVSQLITSLGWKSLQERRQLTSLTFLYKMQNGLVEIPSHYLPRQVTHHYSTRRAGESTEQRSFDHYIANVDAYKNSLLPRTVPLWNSLPRHITTAPSLDSFKARLQKMCQ